MATAPGGPCSKPIVAPKSAGSSENTSGAYKGMSKAEYEEIIASAMVSNLVIPLEAKTWPKHVLQTFIDSEGAIRPSLCSIPNQMHLQNTAMNKEDVSKALAQAMSWLLTADAVLVGSGAGMGVDSGLSTFRGKKAGVWPGLEDLGMAYEEICEPHWFQDEPRLVWGFWRFCHAAYQQTKPHKGYELVREWGTAAPLGAFSFTSNIDGHWEAAGWDPERVVEVHGAVRRLQCSKPCCQEVWEAPADLGLTENRSHRVDGDLPVCPRCKEVARPAVQMFGNDKGFSRQVRNAQAAKYDAWLKELAARPDACRLRLVCLELGCGLTVPTVRRELEDCVKRFPAARLIRVNPEQPGMSKDLANKGVSLPMAAGEAIQRIAEEMSIWSAGKQLGSMKGAKHFVCTVWDAHGGGAEIELPMGATVEQALRRLRRQPGVELELGPSREVRVTGHHLMAPDVKVNLEYPDMVPVDIICSIGDPTRATTLTCQGIRFVSGRSPELEKRVKWAIDVLDAVIEELEAQNCPAKVEEIHKREGKRGVNNLIRAVHTKVLPKFGVQRPPAGSAIMSARIGLAYNGNSEVAEKVAKTFRLLGMPEPGAEPGAQTQQPLKEEQREAKPKPEAKPEPEAKQEPEAKPEEEAKPTLKAKPEEVEQEASAKPEAEAKPEEDAQAKPEPEAKPNEEAEQEALAKLGEEAEEEEDKHAQEAKLEPEAKPEAEAKEEVQVHLAPEAKPEEEAKTEVEAEPVAAEEELEAEEEGTPEVEARPDLENKPEQEALTVTTATSLPTFGSTPPCSSDDCSDASVRAASESPGPAEVPTVTVVPAEPASDSPGASPAEGLEGSRDEKHEAAEAAEDTGPSERKPAAVLPAGALADEPRQPSKRPLLVPGLPGVQRRQGAALSPHQGYTGPPTPHQGHPGYPGPAALDSPSPSSSSRSPVRTRSGFHRQAPQAACMIQRVRKDLRGHTDQGEADAEDEESVEEEPTVKVTLVPGDNSWKGSVVVSVPQDATLADVKAAVAELTGRPDIAKDSKLVRKRESGALMVLKETTKLGTVKQVMLVMAKGLQWPPKQVSVEIIDLRGEKGTSITVWSNATMLQVKEALAQLHNNRKLLRARLGFMGDLAKGFVTYDDAAPLAAKRTLHVDFGDLLAAR